MLTFASLYSVKLQVLSLPLFNSFIGHNQCKISTPILYRVAGAHFWIYTTNCYLAMQVVDNITTFQIITRSCNAQHIHLIRYSDTLNQTALELNLAPTHRPSQKFKITGYEN